MTTRSVGTISFLLLMGVMIGCRNGDQEAQSTDQAAETVISVDPADPTRRSGLLPASRPLVADLPVPMTFALVESISRRYESAAGRYVDLTYEGREDKAAVERFYRERMTSHGWTLRDEAMIRGAFTLNFEKANEVASIRITSVDASGNTAMTIDIHPVSR